MDILYLLIPLSLVLVFAIAALFWWSLRNGQYDDLDGPGYRVVMDDDRPPAPQAVRSPLSRDPAETAGIRAGVQIGAPR